MRQVSDRRNSEHPDVRPGAWRRGWPVLLALLLLVTSGGLGGAGGLAQALRGTPQAGAGAGAGPADGRDPALLRSGARQAVLTQRTADPTAVPASIEPALLPRLPEPFPVLGHSRPADAVRTTDSRAGPDRLYRARAPPAAV